MAEIVIRIEYGPRKSVELKWLNANELRVRVPVGTRKKTVEDLIARKSKWIARSRARVIDREKQAKKDYLQAESMVYLGKEIPFRWEKANGPFKFTMGPHGFVLTGCGSADQAQALIEASYRDRAKEVFSSRCAYFADRLGVKVNQIRVKSQKTRWGSCSSKGNLNFNWHAILAPPEVVDYLVVHELCHLVHMNHSKEFWSLVESICPNYREWRKWLKDHDTQVLP